MSDLPPHLTAKLRVLRMTDPALYTMITRRDPVTDQPLEQDNNA